MGGQVELCIVLQTTRMMMNERRRVVVKTTRKILGLLSPIDTQIVPSKSKRDDGEEEKRKRAYGKTDGTKVRTRVHTKIWLSTTDGFFPKTATQFGHAGSTTFSQQLHKFGNRQNLEIPLPLCVFAGFGQRK